MPRIEGYATIEFDFLVKSDHRITKRVKYKTSHFRTYFNCQHLLWKLNSLQRSFLEYLIEHSDNENRIYVDNILKAEYLKFFKEVINQNPPDMNLLDKALAKLKMLGLIFNEDDVRASYRVNPKYFWVGADNKRKAIIEKLVIKRAKEKLPFNCLIDTTEKDFLAIAPLQENSHL